MGGAADRTPRTCGGRSDRSADQPRTDQPHGDRPDGNHPDRDTPHHDTDRPNADHHDTDHPGTDHHDTDQPNPDQPDIDQAHAHHGETTPAGVSHHRGDPDMGDLPHRVPADPRYFTADVHLTPDGRARIGNHTYTPEQYGDLLRRNGWDGRTPLRLIGCDAGSNDFANRLSRHTGADVLAPTKPAWTDSRGRVYTSDAHIGPDGNRQPRIPPNGEWNTHHPDGTTTRAGDDGFVPGTHDHDKHDLDPTDAQDRAADGSDGTDADPQNPPRPRYRDVPDPDLIDPSSPEFDRRFVDYDRPTADADGHDPFRRDPNPPADAGSPREIRADERGRVYDPAGPPRDPAEVPKVPDVLRDQALPDGSLPANTQFTVTNPNGTTTKFFTDGNGDIKWVEATPGVRPADATSFSPNPDLDYPLLGDVQYRVEGYRPGASWDFHTNERGQTDSMTGSPVYGRSDPTHRDDSGDYSAQGRARGEGQAAYRNTEFEHVRWAGGHLAANEAGGPGEYINMFGQMNASNSGHNRDGWVNAASWRAQEQALARFHSPPTQQIEQYQVEMTRRSDGLPEEVTMRWREVTYESDGVTVKEVVTKQRVFPNVPEDDLYGNTPQYNRSG
ncbi:hypothetical protein AB0G02_37890, partial [Actinosynnema sp. NPDC023658]